MKLSPHFTLGEATASSTADKLELDNVPDPASLERMKYTALKMEVIRQILGGYPIKVNSWFRGPELNAAVGGVKNSQHARGEAVDFTAPWFGDAFEVAKKLEENKEVLKYDQLIFEQTWVHVSFTLTNPRGKELTFLGKNHYQDGIHR